MWSQASIEGCHPRESGAPGRYYRISTIMQQSSFEVIIAKR